MYYIEPFKCKKIKSEESEEINNYDVVEYKYPGEWCVLHSNGTICKLISKNENILLSDKMKLKCDMVGHYWKFKNKNIFTYFDIITIDGYNLTYKTFKERKNALYSIVRKDSSLLSKWIRPAASYSIYRWKSMWLNNVLSIQRNINYTGLVFKKKTSKFGEGLASLNKTI